MGRNSKPSWMSNAMPVNQDYVRNDLQFLQSANEGRSFSERKESRDIRKRFSASEDGIFDMVHIGIFI